MVEKGILTARTLKSPIASNPERVFQIYSFAECEADWEEYAEQLRERGGKTLRRPRSNADLRPGMRKKLAALEHQILFGDAISTGEAAEILAVHFTFPTRLAEAGKIIGRVLENGRNSGGRCWIFSRASCEANVSLTRRLEAAGQKKGRRRKPA
jgi:hypothetical protein